ncbi:MAG: hypothetical protein EAX86_05545 [Candidatus Heimdallarchaeota archaeon]|nr:hypothetical protein [Candidatus Heimdallarchaeota archaeon]
MYIEYVTIKDELTSSGKKNLDVLNGRLIDNISNDDKRISDRKNEQITRLTDRALLLLSFKDISTQNLKHLWNVLDIKTIDQKQNILREIYKLIREGTVYVPRGFIQLIDTNIQIKIGNQDNVEDIDLCLLRPYDKLIREIQKEIAELRTIEETQVNSY